MGITTGFEGVGGEGVNVLVGIADVLAFSFLPTDLDDLRSGAESMGTCFSLILACFVGVGPEY